MKIKLDLLIVIGLTIFSFLLRISNIAYPAEITWDEIYGVKFAQNRVAGLPYFNNHPPLGKILISIGILIFGNNQFGWRLMQAFCGTALIPVTYLIARKLFSHKYAGLITAFLVTFELMFFVYSRIGLLDIFLIFFLALTLLFFIYIKDTKLRLQKIFFILSGFFCGFAIAVKWTGGVLLPILFLWSLLCSKKEVKLRLCFVFLGLAILSYLFIFLFEGINFHYIHEKYKADTSGFIQSVLSWHKLALSAHVGAKSHPDTSMWYTWPLMYKTVWVHFKVIDHKLKTATCINLMGNPFIWWSGLLAIFGQAYTLIFKNNRNKTVLFLLLCYLICVLPYFFIKRVMFLYHYMPALLFLIFILEKTIADLYEKFKNQDYLFLLFFICIVFFFFYFLPFTNADKISYMNYKIRLWLDSWEFQKDGWRWL